METLIPKSSPLVPSSAASSLQFLRRSMMSSTSLSPSAMPDSGATPAGCSNRRAWVFLDTVACIFSCNNATTATTLTSTGGTIEVSFVLADPSAVSRFFVNCTSLEASIKTSHACVICGEGNLLLLSVSFTRGKVGSEFADFFIYKADPRKPSLYLLPRPYPNDLYSYNVGILPCGDGEQYFVVVPVDKLKAGAGWYELNLFSSETKGWSTKVVQVDWDEETNYDNLATHETNKVIVAGGGSLGFVDLWRGVLMCNVLDDNPVMRLIQLPPPKPSNMIDDFGMGYEATCARPFRDVTCSGGVVRFVEIEFQENNTTGSNSPDYGWTAFVSKRAVLAKEWDPCCEVPSRHISVNPSLVCLPPEMRGDEPYRLNLNKVITSSPTLGLNNDDLLYMMSKLKAEDQEAWLLAIDPKNMQLEAMTQFLAERMFYLEPTYCPFVFSNFLGTPADQEPSVFYIMAILLAKDQLRQLEECLTYEMLSFDECISIFRSGVDSSLYLNIQELAGYATSKGIFKASSEDVTMYQRALNDIKELLLVLQIDQSAQNESTRSKISAALGALDNISQTASSTLLEKARALAIAYTNYGHDDEESIAERFASYHIGYVC